MTNIIASEYWPKPAYGWIRQFHYKDVGPQPDTTVHGTMPDLHSWFTYDPSTESVLYIDYDDKMKWKDTWYLKYTYNGVEEWRDDNLVEPESWKTKLFGNRNKIVFYDGYPIFWGNACEIGKTYFNYPKANPFASWPPQNIKGTQSFCYQEKLDTFNGYKDVVTLIYNQSWQKKNYGAKYWMAKGIGPVAVQWVMRAEDGKVLTTNRMDAIVIEKIGYAKDIQT